jgi:hypothetical protein
MKLKFKSHAFQTVAVNAVADLLAGLVKTQHGGVKSFV